MSALTSLGLARGDRVGVHRVPWAGVKLAQDESAEQGPTYADGRLAAVRILAARHEQPHDLLLLTVPPGKGQRVAAALAEALA